MDLRKRIQMLLVLQEHYKEFVVFFRDIMDFLGFKASDIQEDIAKYLQYGPQYAMVQAQRGEGKSLITAIFAVFCIIHNPKVRVFIVSAGGEQANEIATLISRIILRVDSLECLRPNRNEGDRVSTSTFDVYGGLKGVDKSPTVACVGITGHLPGKRADLIIADDIESPKNGRTPGQREIILGLTREFTSICSTGRVIYLGTPQTDSSIYNTLPGRGFTVRIWPGRYPTLEQMDNYGSMLAPLIRQRLEDNPSLQTGGGAAMDQGQPVDPLLQNEETLQNKERDQGPAHFQLQFMLNTKLADAERYPLKPIYLIVMNLNERLPLVVERGMGQEHRKKYNIGSLPIEVMTPLSVGPDTGERAGRIMYVDPAGGGANGDETAYSVVDSLNGKLFVRAVGGFPGGFTPQKLETLAKVAKKWTPDTIKIESNMGSGAFTELWKPVLLRYHKCGIENEWNTKQKETRIIDILEPIMARGSLIFDESVFLNDWDTTAHASSDKRQLYTLMHQMSNITRDRGSLVHDDRLDTLASACKCFLDSMAVDQEKAQQAIRESELRRWLQDPMQYGRQRPVFKTTHSLNPYRKGI